jgi:hypothetical protein
MVKVGKSWYIADLLGNSAEKERKAQAFQSGQRIAPAKVPDQKFELGGR